MLSPRTPEKSLPETAPARKPDHTSVQQKAAGSYAVHRAGSGSTLPLSAVQGDSSASPERSYAPRGRGRIFPNREALAVGRG